MYALWTYFWYCGARGRFLTLKSSYFYWVALQTNILCTRAGIDTNLPSLVIFENCENDSKQNWIFEQIWLFCRATINTYMCNKVKMGNTLQQYRQVVGMHSIYLVVKKFQGCFNGKFWCFMVLLFHLEAIYLPALKSSFTCMKCGKWIACGLHRFICIAGTFLI